MIEHVADAAFGADLALGLGEAVTHVGEGAVRVIGQAVDDDHAVAGAEAFITGLGKILTAAALGLVDGLVDDVAGDLVFLGSVNQAAQGQVTIGVHAA